MIDGNIPGKSTKSGEHEATMKSFLFYSVNNMVVYNPFPLFEKDYMKPIIYFPRHCFLFKL